MEDLINIVVTDGEKFKSLQLSIQVSMAHLGLCYDLNVGDTKKLLFKHQAISSLDKEVENFIKFLKQTVKQILELSELLLNGIPAIIYFSPPTEWVGLPWQYLFYYSKNPINLGSWPTIAIVPNLEWMFIADNYPASQKSFRENVSSDTDIRDSVTEFETLCRTYKDNVLADLYKGKLSQYAVLGHGREPSNENPFANILIPNSQVPYTIDHWLNVSGYDAYVLHACSSARVQPLFAGNDYGGAPGLMLMLKGKVVLAPCIEIEPKVALTLQGEIFDQLQNTTRTYAEVYQAAVEKDERVLFYTLFGLANLPLVTYVLPRLKARQESNPTKFKPG